MHDSCAPGRQNSRRIVFSYKQDRFLHYARDGVHFRLCPIPNIWTPTPTAGEVQRLMATAETIRTIVGVVGNATSLFLFLSPLPTFYKVWRWKSTRQYSGIPYLVTLLNCMLWVFYGTPFVHPHDILVVTINGTGFVLEVIYSMTFFIYSKKPERIKLLKILAVIVTFMAAVVVLTLTMAGTHERRSLIVGLLCVVFGICMYGSPLSVTRLVIRSRSVKYMPFFLSLTCFANGIIWTAYACIRFDLFILIPNGMGGVLGGIQLVLYAAYYKSTSWNHDDDNVDENAGQGHNKWKGSSDSEAATLLISKP